MLGRLSILASVKKSKHCFFKVVFFSSLAYVLAFFGTVHAGPVERMAEALRFDTVSFQSSDARWYQHCINITVSRICSRMTLQIIIV